MRAVFLDAATFGEGFSFKVLEEMAIQWTLYPITQTEEVVDRIRDATIVVTNKVVLTREMLEKSKTKLISVTATGFNIIDTQAARDLGITVCNVRGYSTRSVVEHIFALMLALSRNLFQYVEDTKGGKWQESPIFTLLQHPISELSGKTLGIIGYGSQGKEVEKLGKAFGMKVLIAKHTAPNKVVEGGIPFHEVLKASDFLIIAVPLTSSTRNMIAIRELTMMKKTAFLINTARGGIVNEIDLASCLKKKIIAGAGMDVLTEEPPKKDHPLVQKDVPNLILTPHIAWASQSARELCLKITRENIEAFLAGRPQNVVSN